MWKLLSVRKLLFRRGRSSLGRWNNKGEDVGRCPPWGSSARLNWSLNRFCRREHSESAGPLIYFEVHSFLLHVVHCWRDNLCSGTQSRKLTKSHIIDQNKIQDSNMKSDFTAKAWTVGPLPDFSELYRPMRPPGPSHQPVSPPSWVQAPNWLPLRRVRVFS